MNSVYLTQFNLLFSLSVSLRVCVMYPCHEHDCYENFHLIPQDYPIKSESVSAAFSNRMSSFSLYDLKSCFEVTSDEIEMVNFGAQFFKSYKNCK